MKDLAPLLLLALFGLVAYHTATQGRRGRWWGRIKAR